MEGKSKIVRKPHAKEPNYPRIQRRIQYQFKKLAFLQQALTHPSADGALHYERLELAGDSIINMIVTLYLYRRYPDATEGELAKRRADLCSRRAMVYVGRRLKISDEIIAPGILVAEGEYLSPSIIENVVEAIIGAVYMDSEDFKKVQKVVIYLWSPLIKEQIAVPTDPRSFLQEWAKTKKLEVPTYSAELVEGLFHATVMLEGFLSGAGKATSKKSSMHAAAADFAYKNNLGYNQVWKNEE